MNPTDSAEQAEQLQRDVTAGGDAAARTYFLARLERLIALREQQLATAPQDKLALRLLARALYATYMDCVSVGAGDEASGLLEKAQSRAS